MAPRKAYYDEYNHKSKKLLKKHEKEIMQVYEDAFMEAYEDLVIRTMDDNRYDKKAYFKAKLAYTNQIYEKLASLENKYNLKTSDYYKECVKDFFDMEKEFKNDKKYQELKKAINKKIDTTNEKVINIIKSGKIYEADKNGNFIDLDNRLWNAANASGKKLQDAIASCLSQGMGPAEMARVIQEFGKEGHKTWSRKKILEKLGPGYARSHSGGLDYPALRLARTTHTHLDQLRTIQGGVPNPYVDKVKYHSAHIAGRTCKLCEERDGKVYDTNNVPLDHPNGMCWLESVFNMSDDEIAEDLRKWIRGEPNSGLMDKAYPELKDSDVYDTKKKKKEEPKPKKTTTTKKKETKKKEFKEIDYQSIEDYKNHLKSLSHRPGTSDYIDKAAQLLIDKFPPDIREAYTRIIKDVKKWSQAANDGAYWNASESKVQFPIEVELAEAKKYKKGFYDVWFHETGHAMDYLLGKQQTIAKGGYRPKKLSAQKPFINALKKDFENQKTMLRKKYLKEKGHDIDKYTEADLKRILPDKELNSLYNYYLKGKHKTAGIQDVVEGISNCDIHVQWGHGKKYWNRSNREEEYASEAWANLLGSYSDDETYEYMKEYFPNALKTQQTIITKALKEVNKKK